MKKHLQQQHMQRLENIQQLEETWQQEAQNTKIHFYAYEIYLYLGHEFGAEA